MRLSKQHNRGFTLVEMLVVASIIGILVALLLPAIASVRRSARKVETSAIFTSISAGLESYRNATDAEYPPSSSDAPTNDPPFSNFNRLVLSPHDTNMPPQRILASGANMLVWALAGADLLGTAGFSDLNRDGYWFGDIHGSENTGTFGGVPLVEGLYSLDPTTREPIRRRFGTYIDINKAKVTTLADYSESTLYPRNVTNIRARYPAGSSSELNQTSPQDYDNTKFFLDGFGYPILYYKANVGATTMISDWTGGAAGLVTGVYDHRDNEYFTGGSTNSGAFTGMDMGGGLAHGLGMIDGGGGAIVVDPNPGTTDLADTATYGNTFPRYIWDQQVTVRNEPVNKDTYILISAGPDALWGTDDDVTNFSSKE